MNINPIKTKEDYEDALKKIEHLFNAKPNTPSGDKLAILTTLVQAYEDEHYPMDLPDAVAVIRDQKREDPLIYHYLWPSFSEQFSSI